MPRSATEILDWLAGLPASARDAAIEEYLGIRECVQSASPPGEHMLGYHPSGVSPIVRTLFEVPVTRDDVFVDVGAGLGKAVLLASLLTGARARGIELQAHLVARAAAAAARRKLGAHFTAADARDASLDDGTVFFLYTPFTGPVLGAVLERLRAVAARRAIVVCALGVDLDRTDWLERREIDAFWLSIYDSRIAGAEPRPRHARPGLSRAAAIVAFEEAPTSPPA